METEFTPVAATIGGILIGLSASLMLILAGRVAGISGILAGSFLKEGRERAWRVVFMLGLLVGGGVLYFIRPASFVLGIDDLHVGFVVVAGLLVGFGTRLGNGCTSGHGVCGLSRLSFRSLVATLTFMGSGVATVFVIRHLFGGA